MNNTKCVEIMVSLKYLSNFLRTLEIPSINYEINFHLKWPKNWPLPGGTVVNQGLRFTITNTKLYVSVSHKFINSR